MAFFVFIIGLVIGSFLNVLIDRIPRGEKLTGRSHCESCNKTLRAKDLIPLVSFIWLKGRCRYCSVKLSPQYIIVECLTAVLFTLYVLLFPAIAWPIGLIVISILIVIFVTDLKYGIIPDKIIFPSIFFFTLYILIFDIEVFINHLLSALGSLIFFYLIYRLTKRKGIGFGDVKFSFLIGLIFGFPGVIYALYIAFLTGAAIGTILVLWRKKNLKTSIPFGPFLVLGCIVTLLLEEQINTLVKLIF